MSTDNHAGDRSDELERWLERVQARKLWATAIPGGMPSRFMILKPWLAMLGAAEKRRRAPV